MARTLRRRGVDACLVEDVVQEAGTRAIAKRVPFTDVEDLLRWLNTVAGRIVIDLHRKHKRVDVTANVPDEADAVDIGELVDGRLTLDAVRLCLPQLSDSDVAALLETPEDWSQTDRRQAHRMAMRRLRARARLAAMIDAALAWLIWLRLRLRVRTPAGGLATASPIVLLALVLLLPRIDDSRASRPPAGTDRQDAPRVLRPRTARTASPSFESASSMTHRSTQPPRRNPPPNIVEVPLPGVGGSGRVWARPQDEKDPLACVDTILWGVACVEQIKLRD